MYDYSYTYGMEEDLMEFMSQFGFALLGVVAVVGIIVALVSLALYVVNSIGLHTIAKRRGIHNAWLAWIPVAKNWVLGCISDQYQYVVKGKTRNKRKILLILGIVSFLISSASSGIGISNMIAGVENPGLAGGMLVAGSGFIGFCLNIATLVFYYMALFDLYTSCDPANNVPFLVFSILFRVTEPFFIFFSRKKDGGMPPRREAPRSYVENNQYDGPEML